MKIVRLESTDQGTFGRLEADGFACLTGELPWRDNASGESCVPPGSYQVIWAFSPHLRKFTYRLVGVPERAGVLIHSANLMGDRSKGYKAQLLGCISLGEKLGWIDGQRALLLSRPAVRKFEDFLGRKPFTLEVENA